MALAVMLSPGPDTLLVASHGARGGLRAGLAAVSGIVAGGVYYAVLIGFGALKLLVAAPALFFAVKIAGALYLAWLGAGMIWRAVRGEPSPPLRGRGQGEGGRANAQAPDRMNAPRPPAPAPQGGGGEVAAFRQGFLTNALNPKVAIFYLAALPQFASGPSAPAVGVLLIAIHYAMGAVWLSCVAFAASRARRLALQSAFVRWLEGAVGVFFVGVAGRLALSQR
ncbi:MAG: LysE family translocator [Proteobacteria bacterium]|nr:LysE family translocator [Pseudomonadota bacterium]